MTEVMIIEAGSIDADCISGISEYRLRRAESCAREEDRKNSLAATKALDLLLKRRGYAEKDMLYRVSSKGKPEFENCPLHFNLSHSGKYACAALSDAEVGIDIQKPVQFMQKVADRCMSLDENRLIEASENKDTEFTRLWAKRESAVKLTGEGITRMRETDVSKLFFREYRLEAHCISVCLYNEEKIVLCQNV